MKSGLRSNLRLRVLMPTAVLALLGLGVGAFAFSGTPSADEPLPPIKRPAVAQPKASAKTAEPAPQAAAKATRAGWARAANAICGKLNRDAAELGTASSREELVALLPQTLDLADAALVSLRPLPVPARDRARVARMVHLFERFVALERQAAQALASGDTAGFARLTGEAFTANDQGNAIARSLGARKCAEGGGDESELARALERHPVVVAVLYSPDAAFDRLAIREARLGASLAGAGFVAIDVYDPREIAPVAARYAVRGAPSVMVLTRQEGAVTQFGRYVDRETVAQAADNASI